MNYICGAYTSAPSLFSDAKETERRFYKKMRSLKHIRGLEIPFWGDTTNRFGDSFLMSCLNSSWQNTLTCVPCSVMATHYDPKVGLASNDESGRQFSLNLHKRAHSTFLRFNEKFGRNIFIAVQLVSAPTCSNNQSSLDAFKKSLNEIASWDWADTKITIEHCDKYQHLEHVQKGYLPIEDEISALAELALPNLGIVLNSGRSSIEAQRSTNAINHIKLAQEKNILSGFMFSGTTETKCNYGPWKDLHMPFGEFETSRYPFKQSNLTKDFVDDIFTALDVKILDFIGFKLMALPQKDASLEIRIGINNDAINILNTFTDIN